MGLIKLQLFQQGAADGLNNAAFDLVDRTIGVDDLTPAQRLAKINNREA
jgi:hypothetical protein